MKKYYLMAINCGNKDALSELIKYYKHLIHYYKTSEHDNDKRNINYKNLIDLGDVDAMNSLAIYYEIVEKNYDLMKKYYLMAAEKGHTHAITHLKT